jgi:hypothetical protein
LGNAYSVVVAEILLQPLTRIYPTRRYSKFDYEYLWPNKFWTLPEVGATKSNEEGRNAPIAPAESSAHTIVDINKGQNNPLLTAMEDEGRPVGESENDDNAVAEISPTPEMVASISPTEDNGLSVGPIGDCDHPINIDDEDTEDGNKAVPESQTDVDEGVVAKNSSEDRSSPTVAREDVGHLTVNRQNQKHSLGLRGQDGQNNAVAQVHANNAILALKDLFASVSKNDNIPVVTPQKVDFANGSNKDPEIPFPETEVEGSSIADFQNFEDPSIADFQNFEDSSIADFQNFERQQDESSIVTTSQKEDDMKPMSVTDSAVSNENESDPVLLDKDDSGKHKSPYGFYT